MIPTESSYPYLRAIGAFETYKARKKPFDGDMDGWQVVEVAGICEDGSMT